MNIFSGTQLRSFAAQNEFSFQLQVEPSTSSGISEIGFSGIEDQFSFFYLESGNIFDLNGKHVWSYNPRDIISISGNIFVDSINYFINDQAICLHSSGRNKYYDSFYVKTTKSQSLSYDLNIEGFPPSYQFYFPNSVMFGQEITGYIQNNDILEKTFQIFTGEVFNQNVTYSLNSFEKKFISGGESGAIVLSPILSSDQTLLERTPANLDIFLNTNFGPILNPVIFELYPSPIYYIELITGYTGATGLIENFTYGKYYSYELRTIYPTDQNISILLENISGHTGELIYRDFDVSGNVVGNISKFIYGFDYITGFGTGTGVSLIRDFYGNFFTGVWLEAFSIFQLATGNVNYNYNLLFSGGSGFGPAIKGTKITGLGFTTSPNEIESFILGSRLLTGIGTGNLTGNWGIIFQNSTGEAITQENKFFTGDLFLNTNEQIASGGPLNLEDPNQQLIYINTGNNLTINYQITDSGLKSLNTGILYSQVTGVQLKNIIPFNTLEDFNISGLTFASENSGLAQNLFYNNQNFWYTSPSTTTGYVDFSFSKFSENDKKIVTHYSVEVDLNCNYYPYIFSIEGFNNYSEVPTVLDTRTGENFYFTRERFFELKNTGNFNIIRFKINSGLFWPHRDFVINSQFGIKISRLKYFNGNFISGSFKALNINDNISNNKFIDLNAENGNIFTSYDTGNSWGQKAESLPWVGIDMTYNGEIQSAIASGGYIYVSYNSGETWAEKAEERSWRKIAISKLDGRYQFAITNRSGFFSSNSGLSWSVLQNLSLSSSSELTSNAISENGQYLAACSNNGFLWYSFNFGANWINGDSPSLNWSDIAMSTDGQILTAVVLSGNSFASNAGRIFRSFNGGLNWSPVTTSPVNQRRDWAAVSMSYDGKYQIAIEKSSTGFLSIDSGLNWSPINLTGLDWQDIVMSYSGNFITAIEDMNKIKVSINSGQDWSAKEEARPWRAVAMSKDGLIQSAVAQPPYVEIFSSNNVISDNSYKAFNTGDAALISGFNDNFFLTYKSANPIDKDYNYFYIKFVDGFIPSRIVLQKSLDNINYTNVYQKNLNINKIETGNMVINSGTQYFKWSFDPALSCENINTSSDRLDPIILNINKDQIKICGTLSGNQPNYYTINNSSKLLISNIGFTTYDSSNSSIFNLQTGFYFSSGVDTGQYISSGLINNNFLLFNLLTTLPKKTLTKLDSGIYNIQIQPTGQDIIDYELVLFSADLDQCLAMVENAGFDISGKNLNGMYSISNRYNTSGTWNSRKYYENQGKEKSIWWDGNAWVLGGGKISDTDPNNYTYVYASGNENVIAPYFVSTWVAQVGRPNPNVYRNCI